MTPVVMGKEEKVVQTATFGGPVITQKYAICLTAELIV